MFGEVYDRGTSVLRWFLGSELHKFFLLTFCVFSIRLFILWNEMLSSLSQSSFDRQLLIFKWIVSSLLSTDAISFPVWWMRSLSIGRSMRLCIQLACLVLKILFIFRNFGIVLKMSSTGDDETLTSRCPGVSTRPGHISHSRPRPSSPEVENGINIAGRESLSQYMKILHFFLCELPLILRAGRKKRAGNICKGLQISNLNTIGQLV